MAGKYLQLLSLAGILEKRFCRGALFSVSIELWTDVRLAGVYLLRLEITYKQVILLFSGAAIIPQFISGDKSLGKRPPLRAKTTDEALNCNEPIFLGPLY